MRQQGRSPRQSLPPPDAFEVQPVACGQLNQNDPLGGDIKPSLAISQVSTADLYS